MPHMPVAAEPSPYGPACGFCGVMQPYFTCMRCGAVQLMYLAGAAPPAQQVPGQLIAPVVQAPQHAGEGNVKKVIMEFVIAAARSAGSDAGQHAMAAWT